MKKNRFWHTVLLLYIAFIYSNSLTPAVLSSQESGAVLRFMHSVLGGLGFAVPWLTEHIVRKCAHFGEYFILGMLLPHSLNCTRLNSQGRVLGQLCLTAVFPLIDETLQLFTPGRSGQISDVWLDMGGELAGTVLFILVALLFRRTRQKRCTAKSRDK